MYMLEDSIVACLLAVRPAMEQYVIIFRKVEFVGFQGLLVRQKITYLTSDFPDQFFLLDAIL